MTTLDVAISSCPNDTFSFYYLLHTPGEIFYRAELLDIEELNLAMLEGRFDVIKASFTMGAALAEQYELLDSGSALGFGVGPIMIYRDRLNIDDDSLPLLVALPGEHTTAHFLFDYYLANSGTFAGRKIIKEQMNFAHIMEALKEGETDLGVVIHEGRFVYEQMGLSLFCDLGEYWQEKTDTPVPLGGIFIKKSLPPEIKQEVSRALSQSIERAKSEWAQKSGEYTGHILPYIKEYAAELDEKVIENHIVTYVNKETEGFSVEGRAAIEIFYKNYNQLKKS